MGLPDCYILDNRKAVRCDDREAWRRWFDETADRSVALTRVEPVLVSTVFVGLDRSFGDGPAQLFSTMIFYDDGDPVGYVRRCETWEQAEVQHAQAVAMLTNAAEHGATHG